MTATATQRRDFIKGLAIYGAVAPLFRSRLAWAGTPDEPSCLLAWRRAGSDGAPLQLFRPALVSSALKSLTGAGLVRYQLRKSDSFFQAAGILPKN
ncbi:MAG: twin-arginine translocation signal domain-containing protein [Novosphingobium sp.]